MLQEEHIASIIQTQPALAFVTDFLSTNQNADLYLVGGAVRDALLGRRMKEVDFDFVVGGMSSDLLETWLQSRGDVSLVGQHFGVYKFMPKGFHHPDIQFIDIALPRTEAVASGSLGGYRDFDIQSDPNLSIETDLARRDFTINAMAWDVREKRLIDPFNGQADLTRKIIRAVGNPTERFTEDLSRILRGLRFAAELDFTIEEETGRAMKNLLPRMNGQREVDGKLEYVVPRETVGIELAKALCRNPTHAIHKLQFVGSSAYDPLEESAIRELFPYVEEKILENQKYLDPLKQTMPGELPVVLTLLLRDLTIDEVRHTLSYTGLDTLERGTSLRTESALIVTLIKLLQEQLDPDDIRTMRASEFEKRYFNGKGRVFLRCLELLGSTDLKRAIQTRRKTIEDRWLVDHDESIAPLISGQDVLAQGVPSGPEVRLWIDRVRDLQLDGNLMRREDALDWLEHEITH
jgi:tRNA nucleotidyltransferase/poly(A) polymerase